MRLIFLLLYLAFYKISLADEPRERFSFLSKNGLFELKPSDTVFSDNKVDKVLIFNQLKKTYSLGPNAHSRRYYWSLYETKTNKKLYTIKNDSTFIESKSVLISDNGENIVIVDDFCDGIALPSFEVVHFYCKEKLVKTLTLGDILESLCSLSYSITHIKWCCSFDMVDSKNLKIKSNELYQITYDLNGNLISKISDSLIKYEDQIITADIKRLNRNRYELKISKVIRGNLHSGDTIILNCPDRKMKNVLGYHFCVSHCIRKLNEGFYAQLHLNNQEVIVNTPMPTYNAPELCNSNN